MQKIFGIPQAPFSEKSTVLTIGMFDGVHLGHKAVIRRVIKEARARHSTAMVFTFDTHPRGVIDPATKPAMITSLEHRLALFEELGVDITIISPFEGGLANMVAEDFVRKYLVDVFAMELVVLGSDAHFGRNRSGNIGLLKQLGPELCFDVVAVAPVEVNGTPVSSSAIREAVESGDLLQAEAMLGRPVTVMGSVTAGMGIGRMLTYPTLNLDLHHELHPPRGIYASRTLVGHTAWQSVTYIGHRPTINAANPHDVLIESHILHGNIGDLYGQVAEVEFLKWLRAEKHFPSRKALQQAIAEDVAAARVFFEASEA
ncbi:MAG: bifunctional riboflavin kinase/FAD synthetase [Planctomycetes bacterium]|nr:bifunctional riboflavin kinase/FAD synthetase [Planctomycetota bacterium]